MLSVEISDVSSDPGREVCSAWKMKFDASDFQSKIRSIQKYWLPTVPLRF